MKTDFLFFNNPSDQGKIRAFASEQRDRMYAIIISTSYQAKD